MPFSNENQYHGAALSQIAEHQLFTAINGVRIDGQLSRSAYRVNDNIGVYLKYASVPTGNSYGFTFSSEHIDELIHLETLCARVYIALICVQDKEICCIQYDGDYTISAVSAELRPGHAFRLRGIAQNEQIVFRNSFPGTIFVP